MLPGLARQAAQIAQALEEGEREDVVRLKRFKTKRSRERPRAGPGGSPAVD